MVTRTKRSETGRARRSAASGATRADERAAMAEQLEQLAGADTEGGARGNGPARARRAARAAGNAARRAADALRGPDGTYENASSVGAAVAVGVVASIIESELIPGILIGAGAMLVGKMFPSVAKGIRPVAKQVIRAGLAMTDKAREVVAEAGEQMQDMVAEARAEREQATTERPRARRASRARTRTRQAEAAPAAA